MPRTRLKIRIVLVAALAGALVALTATVAGASRLTGTHLSGAGSTFVQPLVNKWISPVKSQLGTALTYNGVGSTGGVTAIDSRGVDMGMSDAPLSQFPGKCTNCVQMPWALAGTAVVYNLPSLPYLHISGPVLAQMFNCTITKWNAPAIKALNPGRTLPNTTIFPVHRTDGSGTTYNFTDFLSKVSSAWRNGPGTGTSVSWPSCGGNALGGSHSSGVSGVVKGQVGSIGYVDVYYAKSNSLQYMDVKNAAGKYIQPTLASFKAAGSSDTTPNSNGVISIVYPSASFPTAYPICTYTYVDVQKTGNGSQAPVIRKFLNWAIHTGQSYGPALLFQPLDPGVVTWDTNNAIPHIGS